MAASRLARLAVAFAREARAAALSRTSTANWARLPTVVLGTAALVSACAAGSCKCSPEASRAEPGSPSLRLYVLSSVAGALEPCGCVKDMLGGADHAAAYIKSEAASAPPALVLGAGPTLFMDATRDPARDRQMSFKAEALADSLKTLGLSAWAPGANDFLLGEATLGSLAKRAGATLLAANLPHAATQKQKTFEVNGLRVGVTGVSVPLVQGKPLAGFEASDAKAAATAALAELDQAGAQLDVILMAMPRGDALRLLEAVPGYEVAILGKASDQGETNDPPIPPTMIDKTLVVETPNHLQSLGVVDLYVRGNSFDFKDGSGLETSERKLEIQRRLREIRARRDQGGKPADLDSLRRDEASLEKELAQLPVGKVPEAGSYFRFQAVEVRSSLGTDADISSHISRYYQRVNEYNKEAFKDARPTPVRSGEPSYVGVEACTKCHEPARKFWNQTAHAGAYPTLSSQHKEFNLDCVGCHVTGYGRAGGSTVTFVDQLENVQCEVCHGPGSLHAASPKAKDEIHLPGPSLCTSECHHPPHVHPGWSVDEAWTKIIGPGHGR